MSLEIISKRIATIVFTSKLFFLSGLLLLLGSFSFAVVSYHLSSPTPVSAQGNPDALGPCPFNPRQICVFDEFGNMIDTVDSFTNEVKAVKEAKEALINKEIDNNLTTHVDNSLKFTGTSIYLNIMGDEDYGEVALVPALGKSVAYLFSTPPASTEQYVAYLMNSAGVSIAEPAYAQVGGLGFSSLLPILDTWAKFRNLAYLFFVIVFVVIGFMIMFRQKIGSQTVVTVQQAVPQIIIALLAVTFSFAIAGLLIDLMYLSMYLLLVVFDSDDGNEFFTGSLFQIGGILLTSGTGEVASIINAFILDVIDVPVAREVLGVIGSLTGAVVFAIAVAIGLFRLFFELLQTYIAILISIITAPIALMMGAIPGRSHFSTWIKGLIGNLAAFPTVLFVLLIYDNLTRSTLTSDGGGGFLPPYIGGTSGGEAVQGLISIGIIMILPTIVKESKKAFGASGGVFDQFSGALKDAVGTGWKGGELIPGIGATNTANIPYFGSGKDAARKATVGTSAFAGAVGGAAAYGLPSLGSGNARNRALLGWQRGRTGVGARTAMQTGEKMMFARDQERLKKQDEEREKARKG
jgi:hypothetical protein